MRAAPLLAAAALLAAACGGSSGGGTPPTPRPAEPTLGAPTSVVPSAGLPPGVAPRTSNNNLDVVRFEGRVFLAFRTAPTHFASAATTLYVVSSPDEETWEFEAEFRLGRDLREPRFLPLNGTLFLYFATLGANPLDFEPGDMRVSERRGPGDWTAPETNFLEGFIPWRAKLVDGKPYLLGYTGGENIYDFNFEPIEVYWMTTENGRDWTPVVPGKPVVLKGGSSETDFVFLEDGSLLAVSRNEAGDDLGWGTKLCKAPADDLGNWTCVGDPKKYDSPLLFREGKDVYLIGRRNVTPTGNFDLGFRQFDRVLQTLIYSADYWRNGKRTSLWKVDPEAMRVDFALDFPSRGDTCFPGILSEGGGRYTVYNYSSLPGEEEFPWLVGQLGPTEIYRIPLALP